MYYDCMKLIRNLIFLLIVLSIGVTAQERFVRPIDEAPKNASFLAFRKQLIAALEKRDTKFIYGIVDRNIKLGFGGEDGIANFRKTWKIESKDSKFWDEMLTVVKNGGQFDKRDRNLFMAPYLFTAFPEDIDAFDYQAIFGNNVNLRSRPDITAPVVTKLSYNVVKVDLEKSVPISGTEGEYLWLRVETLGGKKGWVKPEYVRSSIDFRAGFERIRGRWTLTFFLAGD